MFRLARRIRPLILALLAFDPGARPLNPPARASAWCWAAAAHAGRRISACWKCCKSRVPVDCVAGTSMGALVAGAWAAGMSPAAMREALARSTGATCSSTTRNMPN
jgi:NTE family protein